MHFTILLPPSEGKVLRGTGAAKTYWTALSRHLLQECTSGDPEKLYSTRRAEAVSLNADALTAPTMPAIERYSGVVYKALDYNSLEAKEQEYINNHVRIECALFGLVPPQEPIPNYVLSITKLQCAKLWLDTNSRLLHKSFVLDLLPAAHRKAVLYRNGLAIDFTTNRNGSTKLTGHEGKRIKGVYVRWLAQNLVTSQDQALQFSEDGYKWNGKTFHQNNAPKKKQ